MRGFPNFNDTADEQRQHWFKICELKGISWSKMTPGFLTAVQGTNWNQINPQTNSLCVYGGGF